MADFQHYKFSAHFVLNYRSLAFSAKSAAKVLLFEELNKYIEINLEYLVILPS